ncbi:MAG: ABC transporter ATP-binding protein [Anaerolineae bacterium]|nr:ABC transporter ATP-binding protein [Anaerolineae bacterium]
MSSSDSKVIDLRNVTKTYITGAGEVTVLKGINLSIGPGRFVSIVGPSGSGKSTLLNMIAGIDAPTTGEVYVAGQPLHRMSQDALAKWRGRHVGVVFQFFQLLPTLTILENVVLPMDFCNVYSRRERPERARELLELVGIVQHADKLPSTLSGGEQQRAAMARALANDPPLIVADEPTGNLDSVTAAGLLQLFRRLRDAGKTLLIVTHDTELSRQTEEIIHLRDGRIEQSIVLRPSVQEHLTVEGS